MKPKTTSRKTKTAGRPGIPDRILDVAEDLFGRIGYAGATTRLIASRARINVGQLHYYFDSKRAIFEAIVSRYGRQVTETRQRLLREAEAKALRGIVPLEVLVDALVRPILLPAGKRKTSPQMHARLFTDPDAVASRICADIYDETNALFVAALRRTLPKLPAETVQWRYYFMMGAYVWTLMQPGRLEAISNGKCDPADMEAAIGEIVPFLCAGLSAPVAR